MAYSLRFEVPSTANGPISTPSPSVHNGFLCVPGQVPSRRGSDQSRDGEIQYLMMILAKYLKVECSASSNKPRYKYRINHQIDDEHWILCLLHARGRRHTGDDASNAGRQGGTRELLRVQEGGRRRRAVRRHRQKEQEELEKRQEKL